MHDDWHLERVVSAISLAAQSTSESGVADALAAAIGRQQQREQVLARKRQQEEAETAHRQEVEALVSGLMVELRKLRDTDLGMSLLEAVEYTAPDPDRRLALYGRCSAEGWSATGMDQDNGLLLKIAASAAQDLASTRAPCNGRRFQAWMKRWPWPEERFGTGFGCGWLPVTCPTAH
jgi:hypothetical protein